MRSPLGSWGRLRRTWATPRAFMVASAAMAPWADPRRSPGTARHRSGVLLLAQRGIQPGRRPLHPLPVRRPRPPGRTPHAQCRHHRHRGELIARNVEVTEDRARLRRRQTARHSAHVVVATRVLWPSADAMSPLMPLFHAHTDQHDPWPWVKSTSCREFRDNGGESATWLRQ
jgi:hypothetical protein